MDYPFVSYNTMPEINNFDLLHVIAISQVENQSQYCGAISLR